MTKTPQQIRNEVEKFKNKNNFPWTWQADLPVIPVDSVLSILTEYDKSIKEEIKPIIAHIENCLDDEIEKYAINDLRSVLKELNELLSKIGNNSETKGEKEW